MAKHWDELFLNLEYERQVKEQLENSDLDDAWLPPELWIPHILAGTIEHDEIKIELEERSLWDDQLHVRLPVSFEPVPRGKLKKSSSNSEKVIFEDARQGVSFATSWMTHSLQADQVNMFLDRLLNQMKQMRSEVMIVHKEMLQLEDRMLGLGEWMMPGTKGMRYHVMFVTSLKERALMGSFQFHADQLKLWKPLSNAIFRVMRFGAAKSGLGEGEYVQ